MACLPSLILPFILSSNIKNPSFIPTARNIFGENTLNSSTTTEYTLNSSTTNEYTSTWSPATALSTEPYILSYSDINQECLRNATDFVYKNGLCGASSPENYLSFKKRYSCSQRCGNPWVYKENGQDECACDVVCVVYNDCCRDMSTVCPDTYAKGKAEFAYLQDHGLTCPKLASASDIATVSSCKGLERANPPLDTLKDVIMPQNINLPFAPRAIKQYSQTLSTFKIADMFTGLVFGALDSFLLCSADDAIAYFIPKITLLDCSNIPADAAGNHSAFHVLKWCIKRGTKDAVTPFHRNCQRFKTLCCTCEGNKAFLDYIHNACIGYSKDAPLLSRHPLWNNQPTDFHRLFRTDTRCTSSTTESVDKTTIRGNTGLKQGEILIEMGIFPAPLLDHVLQKNKSNSIEISKINGGFRSSDISENLGTGSKTAGHESIEANRQVNHKLDEADMMFLVEFNGTDERRFLCDSLQQYLSECQLLDCAPGNILWHDPQRYWQLGSYKCLTPSQVVIRRTSLGKTIPLCFCGHVLMMLSNIGTWNLRMRVGDEGACIFDLWLSSQFRAEEPLEVHALANKLLLPQLRSTKTINSTSFIDRVFKQNVSNQCSDFKSDQAQDVEACIQFSNDLYDEPLCWRVLGGKNQTSNSNCSTTITWVWTLVWLSVIINKGKFVSLNP